MGFEKLRKKAIQKTRKQVKEKLSGKEFNAIKAVNALDDLDSVFNLLFENVLDWYSLHFPELFRIVKEPEKSLELIAGLTQRKNFTEKNILKIYSNEKAAGELEKKAGESAGAEMKEEQAIVIKSIAEKALELKKEREKTAAFIEKEMKQEMPNLNGLAGPLLGARLLREAKSLKRLAFMPASTIQVMGAEKALFRHLKKGSKPPKHGLIFQHPLMRKVKRENRGKMARALSGKISIAAKEDFFGKNACFEEMQKKLEEKAGYLG